MLPSFNAAVLFRNHNSFLKLLRMIASIIILNIKQKFDFASSWFVIFFTGITRATISFLSQHTPPMEFQLPHLSSGAKKDELFLADVNTKLIDKNITTDVKVDTDSKVFTTITIDEAAHGLKTNLQLRCS